MSAEVEGLRPLPLSPTGPASSSTPAPAPASVPAYNSPSPSSLLMPPPSQPASAVATGETGRSVDALHHHHHQLPASFDDTSAQKTPTRDSFFGSGGENTKQTSEQMKLETATPVGSKQPGSGMSTVNEDLSLSPSKVQETQQSTNNALSSPSQQMHDSSITLSQPTPPRTASEDVSMDDAADDDENEGGSDIEDGSIASDRPTKKKKSQRFFCTDYPPCQLSFTRSEHLARHIRKHTGERPFQCHCLRRFSRLDNLRQHAQTVHVNEDIPGDSLAATGTRFQKQIRTDRMRTPGGRHRASTISSASGAHSRGHSRNWSNSSIGSITSELGSPDDYRRRQQPLAMAQASPSRPMTMETYSSHSSISEGPYPNFFNNRPSSGVSTPVSSRFSSAADSPGLRSPITLMSRPVSYGDHTPSRRLSVPSSSNPFAYSPSVQYMSPLLSSTSTTFSNSGNIYGSPTSTVFTEDRGESLAEAEYRRRTWHPSSNPGSANRPATSGLTYYQTSNNTASAAPAPPAPPLAGANAPSSSSLSQPVRLPGIDSFDRAHVQPTAPPRRAPSPMEIDDMSSRRSSLIEFRPETRNSRDSWGSINQHLTQLDIDNLSSITGPRDSTTGKVPAPNAAPEAHTTPPPPSSSSSASSTALALNLLPTHQGSGPLQQHSAPIPNKIVHTSISQHAQGLESTIQLSDPPLTPRKKKRQAWYNGPIHTRANDAWAGSNAPSTTTVINCSAHGTSPEGSTSSEGLPTPSTAVGSDFRAPVIVHSNGYVEGQLIAGGGGIVDEASKHTSSRPEAAEYRPLQPLTLPIPSPAGISHVSTAQHNHVSDRAGPPISATSDPSLSTAQPRTTYSSSTMANSPTSAAAPSASSRITHENTDRLDALVAVATGASQAPPVSETYSSSSMATAAAPR